MKYGTVSHWLARLDRDRKDNPEIDALYRKVVNGEMKAKTAARRTPLMAEQKAGK